MESFRKTEAANNKLRKVKINELNKLKPFKIILEKSKRNGRGKRKSAKTFCKSLRLLGVNSAGLKSKLTTFRKVLTELQPSVFFIEETKYKETGKLKVDNYVIFELVRKNKEGGGLALGCAKELNPVWVREGDDRVEALSVEIFVNKMKIRCCVAYGCQECDLLDRKEAFWTYLDEEVLEADNSDSGFILHFDGNLWAGNEIIPNDPRPQNKNGKLFEDFLKRHPHLTVVNSLPQCEGLITRKRTRQGKIEQSVLDFFVVCHRILPFVSKMVIDESKKHILTNYQRARCGGKATDSDHFTEYLDINLKFTSEKPERIEIFNFKDIESQNIFRKLTSDTKEFTNCFLDSSPLKLQVEKWREVLNSYCKKAFKKIRIKKKRIKPIKHEIASLIDERNWLVNNAGDQDKINSVDIDIAQKEAEESRNIIINNFKKFSENPENVNLQQMWKLMKTLWPKTNSILPTAKRNHHGKVVSSPKEIKDVLSKEYKDRLRLRPIRPDLKSMKARKRNIFKMKLKLACSRKSSMWTMKDLEKALADLKNNKSRDFEGFINEIFKANVIGDNLKKSLLIMLNQLKLNQMIPIYFNFANITTVPKKGSRIEPRNERGLFRVPIVRAILMRLTYNSKYPKIDRNMSDCQMGGRKNKGCKNNIFVINGIIHETLKTKKNKAIVLQIYDYAQMFDSIDLQQALSDIYDVGVDDDSLALIHDANKEIHMSVKTPNGLTDRQILKDIVLQGDTWGSILASVQVDSIGKECMEEGYGYLYKNVLPVGFLGLVDDIIGVTEAGMEAQKLNAFINTKTAEKTLQFGPTKCKSMLVGKNTEHVINSELLVDSWTVQYRDSEDQDIIESYGGQIPIGKTDQQKYLGFIISNKGDNMANITQMKKKSIGVIRKIIQKLNSLNLRNYYFECAMILMNAILRPTILYASDMYYNLKETEVRQLERIEEEFLRKVLKTRRGCPIVQLYLELGQIPARFEIQKMRCLYLKYILSQDENSLLYKFFKLQLEQSSKGDWVSTCLADLKELKIEESLTEIKLMSHYSFTKLLKSRMRTNALKYLIEKQRSKGTEMKYSEFAMAEYLTPSNSKLTIKQKQKMFEVRNRMLEISENFQGKEISAWCCCGASETMSHIYNCEILNDRNQPNLKYEGIFTGKMKDQITIFEKFEENLIRRENIKEKIKNDEMKPPCDLRDPLSYTVDGNG